MAYELPIGQKLRNQGWKVKISDKERLEPPHVTIIRRTDRWRWDLRKRSFMDRMPDPGDVPDDVLEAIEAAYDELCGHGTRCTPRTG